MPKLVRTGSLSLALLAALHQPFCLAAQTAVLEPPRPRMNIAVVEGEGTMSNIRVRKPVNVVVIVRDGNRRPIEGASVTFTVPADGPSSTFAGGGKSIVVQSDKDGYAGVSGIRPNNLPGPYRINVEAKYKDNTATAAITQFNMAVESRSGSGKWIALVAVIGAAAAGGAVAVSRNGGSSGPAAAAPTPIGITAGTGVVGAPR